MFEADLELNCDVFYYWNNPNGSYMKLRGQVDELKLWNSGLSQVDASELQTRYALVDTGSQGPCRVRPSETLEYSITGIGDIYCAGNPPSIILRQKTGDGQLILVP